MSHCCTQLCVFLNYSALALSPLKDLNLPGLTCTTSTLNTAQISYCARTHQVQCPEPSSMKDNLKPPSRLQPKVTWGPPARGPQSEALVWTSHDQKLPVGLLSTAPGQVLSPVGHRRPDLLHLHRWHLRVPEVSRL